MPDLPEIPEIPEISEIAEIGELPATPQSRTRLFAPDSPSLVLAGVVVVVAGLGLIGYTWGRVAGLLQVPLQLPYVLSGGLTGLGLVLVGITVINVTVRRQDSIRRDERVDQLSSILASLARTLDQ